MRRRITRLVLWSAGTLLLLIIIGSAVALWMSSSELMTPMRRSIKPYHQELLARPNEHGVSIQRFTAMEGQVPCLLVLPDAAVGLSGRGETLRDQLTAKGVALEPFGEAVANLVLLHGRNGRKEDLLPVAERFCAVGFRCVIPDLPAHGESPLTVAMFGASDFEASIPAGVLAEAVARFQLPADPAGLWGMSMGGAFLARAASLPGAQWRALVVVCSFDSLDAVVEHKAAFYTKVGAPLLARIIGGLCAARGGVDPATTQPGKWAAAVTAPVFVAHSDNDTLIPLEQGQRLYAAYGSKEKVWTLVKGGGHNRILVTDYPLYAEMAAWYLKYLRPAPAAPITN